MRRVDVHQHIWTASLVEALECRSDLPFIRRAGGLCVVHVAGEAPTVVDLERETKERRLALLEHDGVDCALVAISSPLGIEALPRAEARELIDAHLDGVLGFGKAFARWGPLPLDGACAADADEVIARGCIGVSLPAGALASPRAVDELHAVLARVEELGAPLFVHPGPGRGERLARGTLTDPAWWPAMTRYVSQMQEAWLSLAVIAHRDHPRLRVVFAMLAGCAPLQAERLRARGGTPVDHASGLTFYDTSSYGPLAIEAMSRAVGESQLVYGSDRPVVEPVVSGREHVLAGNAAWLAQPLTIAESARLGN
jgi:predicted TIM-barrel fold metal-dependent hydrolase